MSSGVSISFSGSGFLSTYQLGVAQCLLTHAPWILRTAPFVLGSSAGSLVAAAVVCELSITHIRDEMLNFAKHMRAFTLGPLNPTINVFHWLEYVLQKHLPPDAHRLANGRLAVAMTRLPDGKNTVMSEFQSKEDVVQALLCSCFVPGYCGMLPPSIKGVHYVDGGFTSMQPILTAPSSHTLTVCPFSGEVDICPRDTSSMCDMVVSGTALKVNVANSFRIINALYPMALETLEQAYHSGYKDAIHFLQKSDVALYLMTQSSEPHNYYITNKKDLETVLEEERKEEEETTMWKPFIDNGRHKQMDSYTEDKLTSKLANVEQPLYLDLIQNGEEDTEASEELFRYPVSICVSVLLCNLLSYLSMLGFPSRVLSYLLLPFTLPLCYILQNMHRWESWWSDQAPMVLFSTWHGLKHITLFFVHMLVYSIEKNVKDRVKLVVLLVQWLNVEAEYKSPVWRSTPRLQLSSSPPSPPSQPLSSSDPIQSTVLLHLDQDPEGESVRRRLPRYHSVMG